jgi:hypothetical protein
MSLEKMRKDYEKDSPAGKAFRKRPSPGKLIGYLILAVTSISLAIYMFASTGNGMGWDGMGAMVPLVVGVIALMVIYDTWRRLKN